MEYDLKAMREAIAKCDVNIKIFEEAISKELQTKMEYQRIFRTLQERAARQVVIEVVHVESDGDGED
jgi:hypothetical protein